MIQYYGKILSTTHPEDSKNQDSHNSVIREENNNYMRFSSDNYSPTSTKSSGSDKGYYKRFSFTANEGKRPSKFQASNLGSIQQVRAVGKDILTQALQKRLDNIEYKQKQLQFDKKVDKEHQRVTIEHLRELNKKRREYTADAKLVRFAKDKNADIYFNFEKKFGPRQKRKSAVYIPKKSGRKRLKPRVPNNDGMVRQISDSTLDDNLIQISKSSNVLQKKDGDAKRMMDGSSTPPPIDNYNYLIDDARFAENGSINLISSVKEAHFYDANKSNEDLEQLENDDQKVQIEVMNPISHTVTEKDHKVRAKAIFRKSGKTTSREHRAKAISLKKDRFRVKKSKPNQQSYAINYTEQENHFKKSEKRAVTKDRWSPKRFKRYPRFTIFLNNLSKKEDVISLNPQFLNFLMSPEKSNTASKQFNEALNLLASQNLRQFDPFDKVVLSHKGIDNPILTSFRTLAKTNNSLSDTFKIIHNKFLPNDETRKNSFFNLKKSEGASKSFLMNPPPDFFCQLI